MLMDVSGIEPGSQARQALPVLPGDRDGGADRAQEIGQQNSPAAIVTISQQARTALANDADHGADGK